MYCYEKELSVSGVLPRDKLKLKLPNFELPQKEFKKKYDLNKWLGVQLFEEYLK